MINITIGLMVGLVVAVVFFGFSMPSIWRSFGTYGGDPPKTAGQYFGFGVKLIWGAIWRVIVLVIVGGVIGFVVASARGKVDWIAEVDVVREQYKLISLQNNTSINGFFVLGTGRIGADLYYEYFYEFDGGFVKDRLNASKNIVVVYEEDRQDGILLFFGCKRDKDAPRPKSLFDERISWPKNCRRFNRYEFHIPRGSILRDMQLK